MTGQQFTQGLDPDPAVQQLVRRLHRAMAQVPAPPCLCYSEVAYSRPVHRLVTPTVLYELGPMREWLLGLARELLAGGGGRDVDSGSGPCSPAGRRAWDGTTRG